MVVIECRNVISYDMFFLHTISYRYCGNDRLSIIVIIAKDMYGSSEPEK